MTWQGALKLRVQLGLTLISMLVGSMVSMTVLITGVTFYKNHMQSTASVVQMSSYANNLSFLLNFIEIEAFNAGYGFIDGVDNYDAAMAVQVTTAGYQDVYWAYDSEIASDKTELHCNGFRERVMINPDSNQAYVMTYLLEPVSGQCSKSVPLTSLQWQEAEPIVVFEGSGVSQYLAKHDFLLSLQLVNEYCMPFGLRDKNNARRKALEITSVYPTGLTKVQPDPIDKLSFNICLPNVKS